MNNPETEIGLHENETDVGLFENGKLRLGWAAGLLGCWAAGLGCVSNPETEIGLFENETEVGLFENGKLRLHRKKSFRMESCVSTEKKASGWPTATSNFYLFLS